MMPFGLISQGEGASKDAECAVGAQSIGLRVQEAACDGRRRCSCAHHSRAQEGVCPFV